MRQEIRDGDHEIIAPYESGLDDRSIANKVKFGRNNKTELVGNPADGILDVVLSSNKEKIGVLMWDIPSLEWMFHLKNNSAFSPSFVFNAFNGLCGPPRMYQETTRDIEQ